MPEVSRNLLLFVGLIWNHLIVMEFQRSSEDRNHRGGEAGVKKIQYKLVGKAYWCIGCVCVCVCVCGGGGNPFQINLGVGCHERILNRTTNF